MKSVKQEGKVVKGSIQEIGDWMADEKDKKQPMEPGAHNILIYNDLKTLRESIASIQGLCYVKTKSL